MSIIFGHVPAEPAAPRWNLLAQEDKEDKKDDCEERVVTHPPCASGKAHFLVCKNGDRKFIACSP